MIGIIFLIFLNVILAFLIKMSRKTTFWVRVILLIPPVAIIYCMVFGLLTFFYFIKYYLKD